MSCIDSALDGHTNELSELNSILEGHMKRGSSSDFTYAEYSSNQPTLVQEQPRPKPNIFPSLTADEKEHEFGYLIALERTQRALWFKNPTAFKEDVENYNSNMIKQGILPQDEPSKLVNYYMAYVIKRIASVNNLNVSIRHMFSKNSLDYQIDADKPQTFNTSSNRAELIFLWTSLILLGSLITEKKINHKSIKVGHTVDTSNELGLFSLFSAKSFYNTTFKALLDKDMINNYLLLSSTSILEDEYIDEIIDLPIEKSQITKPVKPIRTNITPVIPGPPITAKFLYQLAEKGDLAEIKKYTFSADIITQQLSYFTATFYSPLMVATVYRYFDIVRYFIEEKQADCTVEIVTWNDRINLIQCAKAHWIFISAPNQALSQYIEDAFFKHKQKLLAYQFINSSNRTDNVNPAKEQVATLMNTVSSESVCVTVAKAYEQTSSTQEILTLLSSAVALKDKTAALDLGQRYQINSESLDLNASFDAYLEAVKLGEEEALVPLERLAQRVSAEKKLELSTVYQSLFHNDEKAAYWRSKSMEQSNSSLTL